MDAATLRTVSDPTVERVERYYALLCRLGLDRVFDRVAETSEPPTGRPVTIAEQEASPHSASAVEISIDINAVFLAFLRGGVTRELAEIVFGIAPEEAGRITHSQLKEAFPFFVKASMEPIYMVLSADASVVSGQAAEAT